MDLAGAALGRRRHPAPRQSAARLILCFVDLLHLPFEQIRVTAQLTSIRLHTQPSAAPSRQPRRPASPPWAKAHGGAAPLAPRLYWASQFRPDCVFFCLCVLPIIPENAYFTENPLSFMHILTHKPCIACK